MSRNLEFESLLYDLYGGGKSMTVQRVLLAANRFQRKASFPYGEGAMRKSYASATSSAPS